MQSYCCKNPCRFYAPLQTAAKQFLQYLKGTENAVGVKYVKDGQ